MGRAGSDREGAEERQMGRLEAAARYGKEEDGKQEDGKRKEGVIEEGESREGRVHLSSAFLFCLSMYLSIYLSPPSPRR